MKLRITLTAPTLGLGLLILTMAGCGSGAKDIPWQSVDLDLSVVRLDEALYQSSEALKKGEAAPPKAMFDKYFSTSGGFITDWMFGGNDSIATDSMMGDAMSAFAADPHGQILLDTLHKVLGEWDITAALEAPLKRYKYYFPNKTTPTVVAYADGYPRTAQAGLDQIFISPNYLGIGVHYFMGPNFQYYPLDLPKYIRRRCTPEHLPALVVNKMADLIVPEPDLGTNPVLIDYVIQSGIKAYLVDKLLGPETQDTLKLYYEASQLDWALLYEGRIYKDLVKDLYSADATLQRRYVDDSPFTSQLNRGSAPRLGQYIGWRIVQAYMTAHPEVSMDELVERRDYQKIFKDSGYRPPHEG